MSMAGYTKLFNSILASTIWRAPDKTRIVWITLLAMADKNGIAEGSIPGIADFARVSVPACRKAVYELMAPDKDSRSQEHDGRRIEPIDGGWRILNHGKYRERLNADERREYFRLQKRKQRAKTSTDVQDVPDNSTVSTEAEAEAERTESTAASPRFAQTDNRKPEENYRQILAIVHKEILPTGERNIGELEEATKGRCAKLHIAYDSEVIRKAVESALVARGRRGRAE